MIEDKELVKAITACNKREHCACCPNIGSKVCHLLNAKDLGQKFIEYFNKVEALNKALQEAKEMIKDLQNDNEYLERRINKS